MSLMTRKSLITLSMLGGGALALAGGFIWSGLYNIGADDVHTRPVYAVLQMLRERSIEVRASQLKLPDLSDPARIKQGAGNFNAMCTGCHLAPGMPETELSKGLYPTPPNLSTTAVDPAEAFWVTKHGIKASGMPAWGKSMDDEYIWNMVAFVQTLPSLSPEQYRLTVASSGGHSHGGGESGPHAAMPGMEAMEGMDHHDAPGAGPHEAGAPAPHDDAGKPRHSHDTAPAEHDDTGKPPHSHDAAPATHDDAGSPPHDHGTAAATSGTAVENHSGH